MSLEYLGVPNGLRELLKGLAKEVLREKPPNLYEFSALYFESVMQKQHIGHASHEKTTNYENAFRSPTSIALVFQIIPEGLTNLIKDFVKTVLRKQPENICEFAVQYFRGQVQNNSHKEMFSHSSILHTTYENYLKIRESYITYSPCTCGRPRRLEDAESLSDSIAGKISSEIKLDKTNQHEMLKSTKNHPPKNFKMTQEVASVIIQRRLRKLFAEKFSKSRKTSIITNTSIKDNISEVASYTSDSTVEMSAESVGEAKEKEVIEIGITTSPDQTTHVIKQSSEPQEELKTPTENCMSPEVGCVKDTEEVDHYDESFRTISGILKPEESKSDSGKSNTEDLGSITKNESGYVEKYDNSKISNSVILKQSTENFQIQQPNINENIYPNSEILLECTKYPKHVDKNRNGNNSEHLNQYKNGDDSESQRLNEVPKCMASDEGDKTNKDEFKNAEQNYIKEVNLKTKNHAESELVIVVKGLEAEESNLLIDSKEEHRENTSIQLYKSIQENEEITKKSVEEDSIQYVDIETLIETCGPMEIPEENKAKKRKSTEIDGTSIETKISSGTSNEDLSKPKSVEEKFTDENVGKNTTNNTEQYREIAAKFSENQVSAAPIVNKEKGSNDTLKKLPESTENSKVIKELEDPNYNHMVNTFKKSGDRNDQIKKQDPDKKIDVRNSETDLSAIVKSEEQHECSTVAGIHSSNHTECQQYGPENVRMENIPAHLSTTKKFERHISENSMDKLQNIVHETTKSLETTQFIQAFQEESLPINYELKHDGHDTFSEFGGKTERITNGNQNSFKISQTQSDETKTWKETAKSEKILYEKNDVLNINNDGEKILMKLDFYKDEALESSAYNDIDDQLKSHPLALEILQSDEIHAESLLNEIRSNDIVKSETHSKICELNVKHVFDNKEDDSEKPTKSNFSENSEYQFPESDDFRKSETQDTEKVKAVNNISYDNRLGIHKQESQIELNITNENNINVLKNHPENNVQIRQKSLNNETSVEYNKTDHSKEKPKKNNEPTSLSSKSVTRTLCHEEMKTDSNESDERQSFSYSYETGINKYVSIRDESDTQSCQVDNIQYEKISNNDRTEQELLKLQIHNEANQIITAGQTKNLTSMDEFTNRSNETHSETNSIDAEVQNEFIKGEVCNTQILPETISDKENFSDKNRELKENFNIEVTPKNVNNKTEDGITLKDSERQSPNFLYSLDEFFSEASARSTTKCMGIIEAEDSSSTGGCETDARNMTNQKDSLVQDTVSPNSINETLGDQDLNKCKAVELLVTNDITPQLVTEEIAHQERTEIPNLNECYNSMMSEDHANRKENSRNLNPIESANLNNLIIPAMPVEILNTIIELNEPNAFRKNESNLTEDLLTQTDENAIEMRKQKANNAVNDATDRIQFGSGSDNDSECTTSSTCSKETDENVFSDAFVNESTDKTLNYPIRRSSLINSCEPNQGGIYEMNPSSELSFNSKLDIAISDEDNVVDDKETNTSCPALYYKDPNSQIAETAFDGIENHNDVDPNLLLEQYINQVTFSNTYDQMDVIHKTELSSRKGFSDNSKVNEPTENPYVTLKELKDFSGNMVHAKSRTEESINSTNDTLTAFTDETTKITEIQKIKSPVLIHPTELSVNQKNLNDTDIDPKSKRTTSAKLDTIASQSFTKSSDKVRNASATIIQNAYRTFRTNQTKTTIDEEFKADTSIESTVRSVVGMDNNQSNMQFPSIDAASFLSIHSISPLNVPSPTPEPLEHLSETSSTTSNLGEMFSASKSDSDQVISQESSSMEKHGERADVRQHADNDDNVDLKTEEEIIECIDSQIDTNKTNTALNDFQDKHDVTELDSRIEYDINKPPSTRDNSNKNISDEIIISNQCHAVGKMNVERDNGISESRRVCTSEEEQLNLGSISLQDLKSSIPYRKLEESLTKKNITCIEIDNESNCKSNDETSVSSSDVQYRLRDCDRDKREEYSLEEKTAKLQEADEIIKKMQQRRASETRVGSIDDRFSQEARFDEPILISMKELQKTETFEMEDDSVVVLKSLESQCKDSREGSAQSQKVVFGIESKTQYDDKYNDERIDLSNPSATKDSLQRLCKTPDNESKVSSKSVTIDDSVKYIEPLESETTTITSSSCNLGNNATEDFNKMVRNCSSLSEIDSVAPAKIKTSLESTENSKNDFHIMTTDTEPTIKSAATKIQAVARGFLIRKRLRQSSIGVKYCTKENKGSFRNATIVESSLGKLFEEENSSTFRKLYHGRGIKSLCTNNDHDKKNTCLHSYATFDGEKIYEHEFSSFESGLAARRHTLQRGDAVRNDSTPDEENFGTKDSQSTPNPFQVESLKGKEKIAASCRNTEPTSSAADNNKKINNKLKWFMLRQNSMPVQIESEVFRVVPKHMRKRIKSAGCQKQKLSRAFKG